MRKAIPLILLLILICPMCFGASPLRVYSLKDMESFTKEAFTKDFPNSKPGEVCGKFTNQSGCMKLIYDESKKGAVILQLQQGKSWIDIYKFSAPSKYVFLQKTSNKNLEPQSAENKRDEVELHYYEKSAVKFFYNGRGFEERWISD